MKFQKLRFTRLNYQFQFILFWVYDQSGLEIKNQDYFPTIFNATSLVVILESLNE